MKSGHLDDPLDYLYEELSPERMAEARAHLATCPECREEIRKIRETVKICRQAEPPVPPKGLAERTAAIALEMARAKADPDSLPAAPPDAADGLDSGQEEEFARIKREVMSEVRSDRRSRLFHPAWAVAASVTFVCFLLIHFSPRNTLLFDEMQDTRAAPPQSAAPAKSRPEAKPLPAPAASPAGDVSGDRRAIPPHLREAKLMRPRNLNAPLPEAAASPMDLPMERDAEPSALEDSMATGASSSLRPPAPSVSAPAPMREDALPPAPAMPAPAVRPVPEIAAPVMPEQPAAVDAKEARAPARMRKSSSVSEAAAEAPAADARPEASAPPSEPAEVLMFEGFDPENPPRMIARPTPIDTVKLARDLSTLAGMQIGSGDIADAWITIGMLRRYDPEKANELTAILEKMEAAEEAEAEGEIPGGLAEPAERAEAEPAGPPVGDKYLAAPERAQTESAPAAEPAGTAPDAVVPEAAGPSGEAGEIPPPVAEPGEEYDGGEPPVSLAPEMIDSPAAPLAVENSGALTASGDEPYYYIGPVVTDGEPPPAAAPAAVAPAPQTATIAPDVPKASPGALPPTLWERGGVRQSRERRSAADSSFRRGTFTTDPYWRGE